MAAMLALLLAIAIDFAPLPAPAREEIAPPQVYLHPPTPACGGRTPSDEIVVCGAKDADEHYRLRSSNDVRFAEKPVRAEVKMFGNSTLKAHVEGGTLAARGT